MSITRATIISSASRDSLIRHMLEAFPDEEAVTDEEAAETTEKTEDSGEEAADERVAEEAFALLFALDDRVLSGDPVTRPDALYRLLARHTASPALWTAMRDDLDAYVADLTRLAAA